MRKLFAFLIIGSLATACYPGGAKYVDQLDLVYTNYNPDFNFSSVETFTIPDSIPFVEENSRPNNIEYLGEPYKSTIISQLREEMESRGYTYVDKASNPDLILFPTASTDTETYYYYWGGYWSWWGWGGGWYYPGYYPGYGYSTSYEIGTVMVQAVFDDPQIPDGEDKPVQWVGLMNGLIQGKTNSIDSRIESSVRQMFVQSEYFRK
jgi:hypothetical protein